MSDAVETDYAETPKKRGRGPSKLPDGWSKVTLNREATERAEAFRMGLSQQLSEQAGVSVEATLDAAVHKLILNATS